MKGIGRSTSTPSQYVPPFDHKGHSLPSRCPCTVPELSRTIPGASLAQQTRRKLRTDGYHHCQLVISSLSSELLALALHLPYIDGKDNLTVVTPHDSVFCTL